MAQGNPGRDALQANASPERVIDGAMAKLLQLTVVIVCFAYAIRVLYDVVQPMIPLIVTLVVVGTLLWFFLRRRR